MNRLRRAQAVVNIVDRYAADLVESLDRWPNHRRVDRSGELGFAIGMGLLAGGLAAANVEMMPAPIRCTGLAFAYNASIGWFGGTTPLIAAWLISSTGNPIAPGYWVAAAGGISLLAAIFLMRETRHADL